MTVPTRRSIQYEDFALEIRPEAGGYRVRVRAPFQGPEGSFQPPFDPAETERMMVALERTVRGSDPSCPRNLKVVETEEPLLSAEEVGAALFQSLFAGPVRESFLVQWGQASARKDCGLRIRLQLDPSRPELAALCALPWELLYRGQFLSRDVLTPVVRCLDTQSPWSGSPAPSGDRLRILVAMASPRGCSGLDLPRERRRIEAAWGSLASVEVSFLEGATIAGVRRELRNNPFHVLHFMGHGTFDHKSGEGLLLFEDPQGGADSVSGAVLAETCRGNRNLRLVFLNACDTARLPRRQGHDPYTGVASALVLRSVPAVVAMQFQISDEAAIAFSGAVYSALAEGDPIDAAVAEGRLVIYQTFSKSLEWATPVLFLSTVEGVIHTPAEEVKDREEPARPTRWTATLALVLAVLVLAAVLWGGLTGNAGIGSPPRNSGGIEETEADLRAVAFSLGASLAMLGQSSEAVGRSVFEQELARLGLETNEKNVLFAEYRRLEDDRRPQKIQVAQLTEGREQLRRAVVARLQMQAGPEKVPYLALGQNVSHLYLVLRHWDELETNEARRAAADDVEAILTTAPQIQLPDALRRELEAFRSRDLGKPEERAAALRTFGEVLRFFQSEDQGG